LETKVTEQESVIAQLQREVARLKRAAGAAEQSAAGYRALFDSLDAGLCIIDVLFDGNGNPVDYRVVDVNLAFERQTGLTNAVGRSMRSLASAQDAHLFGIYADVALSGEPRRFENPTALQGRFYEVYAFRTGHPEERRVGILFTDITARKRAEAAQREAGRVKDQFLATLAHELRNPLAPLQSGIEVLRLAAGDPVRSAEVSGRVLEIMTRQIGHLRHLMDELLDVSRINRGVVTLHSERQDLLAAIRRAVEQSRTSLYAGNRQVTIDLPAEPLMVDGDRERLAQVVAALLDNAGKFTADDGRIRLKAERRNGRARITVQDDGVGIDADMLGEIFAMFSQARTDRHGLGIGLTLVRNLVELHGGTVEARSAGRGQGSEFVVELPLEKDAHPEPAALPQKSRLPALERQRMLVVDDNHDAADSLTVLLSAMGAEVRTAYDGRSALLLLDELQPQIVFLDIGMPEMDGYEVAKRVRLRQSGDEIVLVAVTGWGQPADRQRAKEAGFDSHLVKPATFEDLRRIFDPEHETASAVPPDQAYS
jgi:signal transduction histidine kinase/CheY-like chemotaxis protein